MSAIEEIKQKLDIVEIAGRYTQLTKAGKNFKGVCPFHQEKHGSFFVFPDRQSWHCFGACSTGGDIFSLVMKKEGIEFAEALKMLAVRAGVTLPVRGRETLEKQQHARLYEANEAARDYYYNLFNTSREAEKARQYALSRGLNAQSLMDFKLGFSPSGRENLKKHLLEKGFSEKELLDAGLVIKTETGFIDRFHNRLMFPINNTAGRTTGFGGREMDGSQPKYLNSPESPVFDKSGILYGLDLAREEIRRRDQVVLVEGYMDVIIARQYGFTNTVAAMGTAISEKQIDAIKKLTRNLVLAMDADEAGEKAVLRGIEHENSLGSEIKVALMSPGLDPDAVIRQSAQDWSKAVNDAEPLVDFIISKAAAECDLSSAAGKSRLVDRILPVIAQMNNLVRQAHYLQKLSKMVNVNESRLEASLKEMKTRNQTGFQYAKPEVARTGRPLLSNQREEYCLALLIQHPQLRQKAVELETEYFSSTENALIFSLLSAGDDIETVKNKLDFATLEYMERLGTRPLIPGGLERKLEECVLLLKENYLRTLMQNQEAILSSAGLSATEKEALLEESMKIGDQLKSVFWQKSKNTERIKKENNASEK
ncbi:MAG: DNA primase [Dehalococcoidaceae bacterium]|nr:DNA primase [Dehalococcoidaceae bacterium]